MNVFKRLTAIVFVLSMLLVSVNAEGTVDLYFNASLDLKTGETTLTETQIIGEKDFSDLMVEVTKINTDGTESIIYIGPLGGYDNGRWAKVDFTDRRPLLLCDWQTKNCYWVFPLANSDLSVENEASAMISDGGGLPVSTDLDIISQITLNGIDVGEDGLRIMDNANMLCSLNISNTSEEDSGLTAILTTYSENGKLYNVSTFDIDVDAGETVTREIEYIFDTENEYTGKIMFWDSMTTLLPIRASIDFSQTSGVNAYYYDADNRLLQIDKTNGTSILFTYDNMGNLLSRTARK